MVAQSMRTWFFTWGCVSSPQHVIVQSFLMALAVLHLCLLRCSPQHKSCWLCRLRFYVTQIFLFPLFLYFFILEFRNLFLSIPSVLSCVLFCSLSCPSYSFLLFFLLPVLFVHSLFIHFIFWSPLLFSFQLCYPFFSFFLLLYSACSSLMLYYCSICSLFVRALCLLVLCCCFLYSAFLLLSLLFSLFICYSYSYCWLFFYILTPSFFI